MTLVFKAICKTTDFHHIRHGFDGNVLFFSFQRRPFEVCNYASMVGKYVEALESLVFPPDIF